MNSFTKATRDNFKFRGNLNYFTLRLTNNFTMTVTSLHYPQTIRLVKLLTLNMVSKVPRGQIKKVFNFVLWFDIHWYGLSLLLNTVDELKCYNWVSCKLWSLKWRGKWSEYHCCRSSNI